MLAATRFKFTGDYDQAIEQIDQAIKADPANPRFYADRGVTRGANQQFREAVEDLDRAISLDPGSSVAFLERGALYASMSEFSHAIEDYDEAIKLFSTKPVATCSAVLSTSTNANTTGQSRISASRSNWIRFARPASMHEASPTI